MALLSREDVLNAEDIQREIVPVPEWAPPKMDKDEAELLVRGLTAQQYIGMGFDLRGDNDTVDPEKMKSMMPMVVAMGVIDEEGKRVFSDKDINVLGEKSFAPVERLSAKILELSGISTKEAEKN